MVFVILTALLPLFILIGVGYGLRRWAILHHEHVPIFNRVVMTVLLPATVLKALVGAPAIPHAYLLLPAALLLGQLTIIALFWLFRKRLQGHRAILGALIMTACFGNTAFLGYPITQTLHPSQFPAAVMIDLFGMTVWLFPIAAMLASRLGAPDKRGGTWKPAVIDFVTKPIVIAVVAGLIWRQIAWPASWAESALGSTLSHLTTECVDYLSKATTAVVLIALGVALEPKSGKGPITPVALAVGMKLLGLPLIVWLISEAIGVRGDLRSVLILQSAVPSGVTTCVLAQEYGMGERFAVKVVCLSTVLSLVTIPIVLSLLQ